MPKTSEDNNIDEFKVTIRFEKLLKDINRFEKHQKIFEKLFHDIFGIVFIFFLVK